MDGLIAGIIIGIFTWGAILPVVSKLYFRKKRDETTLARFLKHFWNPSKTRAFQGKRK